MLKNSNDTLISTESIGRVKLCKETHTLFINNEKYHLRNKLFLLFEYLMDHQDKLIKREELITNIWSGNYYIGEKGLTHAICMLRNMLRKDPNCGVTIDTIPKTGYRLRVKSTKTSQTVSSKVQVNVNTDTPQWWPKTPFYTETEI